MNIDSPVQLLTLMASTQTQVDKFSDDIIHTVRSGDIDPLKVLIQIKAMDKASKRIIDEIMPNILKEAEKYQEKNFDFYGNRIEKAEVGIVYDYSVCEDREYDRIEKDIEDLKGQLKRRETFLKGLSEATTVLDEETGEIVRIKPPLKKSSMGVKVFIQ